MNAATAAQHRQKRATDPEWRDASAEKKRQARRAADPDLAARTAVRADCRAHVDARSAWLRVKARVAAAAEKAARKEALAARQEQDPEVRAYENAKTAIRRARRKKVKAPGFTIRDFLPFYRLALHYESLTGIPWEVDHIVSYALGGLHEPKNLQVLPRVLNQIKGIVACGPIGATLEHVCPT